ncbi:MAG: hypothetical protein GF334_10530 [Candidatus Altiarchaeales archaeon]|nr:hypothetical protein [Candidatus Altiarchaeales archaeon]
MSLDFLSQQPYTPVCLMTSMVLGTQYVGELDYMRRFRDEVMLEAGALGRLAVDFYYLLSRYTSALVAENKLLRKLLLNTVFKPALRLLEFIYPK